ncbi:hypothetical protein F5Y02DRAFT_393459, partial [Annulohypoxylon stygium]
MDDPWQRLEYYRQKHQWDDLEYHIEKYLLEEALIDQTRSKREDELGNRRLEDELEAMHDLQKTSPVYRRQRRRFEMRTVGWSEEDDDEKKEEEGGGRPRRKSLIRIRCLIMGRIVVMRMLFLDLVIGGWTKGHWSSGYLISMDL